MPRWGMIVIGILAITGAAIFLFQNEFASTGPTTPEILEAPTRVARPLPRRPIVERPAVERPPEPTQVVPEANIATPTRAVLLPALADSDPFVRNELEPLGLPSDWVSQDDLVRGLAVFADNATRGELARRPLAFLKPAGRFEVVEREGRFYADPRNALRFDALLDLLEAVDPNVAAQFLWTIDPLLETAFQELGSPLSTGQALDEAIERIAVTPRDSIGQELVQSKVLYEYKDPSYENLPPFEKQLLRLGARNLDRLERFLRALRANRQPTS